ncbi:MAG: IclR family transcriptional regulator [Vicinamibacterales bacterium]
MGAIDRAASILFMLGSGTGEAGLGEIAARTAIDQKTAYRLLTSMRQRGLVDYTSNDRRYRLGLRLVQLGLRLESRLPLRAEALSTLYDLRDLTGETAILYIAVGDRSISISQAVSVQEPHRLARAGDPFPLHWGGRGKVLLAYKPDRFIEGYLDRYRPPLESEARHRIGLPEGALANDWLTPSRERIWAMITKVRRDGFALSLSEFGPDTNALIMPLLNGRAKLLGAISVAGPADRWTLPAIEGLHASCEQVVDELRARVRYLDPSPLLR